MPVRRRVEIIVGHGGFEMYCTPPEMRKARKQHRCMHCSEAIEIGEKYQRWMSVDDGKAQTNVMHPECLDALNDEYGSGYWEYTPYEGERPNASFSQGAEAAGRSESAASDS